MARLLLPWFLLFIVLTGFGLIMMGAWQETPTDYPWMVEFPE